jgi:hypothetical protein
MYDFCKNGVGGKSEPSGITTRWNSAIGRVKIVVTKVRGNFAVLDRVIVERVINIQI